MKRYVDNMIWAVIKVLIGVMLILDPVKLISLIVRIAGLGIFGMGIWKLYGYFSIKRRGLLAEQSALISGILVTLAGLFCMERSRAATGVLTAASTTLFALILLVCGIIQAVHISAMRSMGIRGGSIQIVSAVLTILLALMVFANPFATADLLWTVTGIGILANAVPDLVLLIKARRWNQKN